MWNVLANCFVSLYVQYKRDVIAEDIQNRTYTPRYGNRMIKIFVVVTSTNSNSH